MTVIHEELARRVLDRYLSEKQWQTLVVEAAGWLGWLVYHPYDSRRSEEGFPDLVLCRPGPRPGMPGRVLFVELKTETGRVKPAQQAWLSYLRTCPGVEVYVWRPGDWVDLLAVLAAQEIPRPPLIQKDSSKGSNRKC